VRLFLLKRLCQLSCLARQEIFCEQTARVRRSHGRRSAKMQVEESEMVSKYARLARVGKKQGHEKRPVMSPPGRPTRTVPFNVRILWGRPVWSSHKVRTLLGSILGGTCHLLHRAWDLHSGHFVKQSNLIFLDAFRRFESMRFGRNHAGSGSSVAPPVPIRSSYCAPQYTGRHRTRV
jgi:hypothetical protein